MKSKWLFSCLMLSSSFLYGGMSESSRLPVCFHDASLKWSPVREFPCDQAPSLDLPDTDLAKYFSVKPQKFLVDPQKILDREEYRDHLDFLKNDDESTVGFYIYLFEGQQKIPTGIRLVDLWQQHFAADGPVVLVFYFMGDPSRSEIHISPDLMRSVGKAESARALQSAIRVALTKSHPVDQFGGFYEQMSTRIYWMENVMKAGVIAPAEQETPEAGISQEQNSLFGLVEKLKQWQWHLGAGLVLIVGVIFFCRWKRQNRRYRLPVCDEPARLGGDYGAGVGAVMSYANPYLSAQAQREKAPDEWDML